MLQRVRLLKFWDVAFAFFKLPGLPEHFAEFFGDLKAVGLVLDDAEELGFVVID